MSRHHSSHAHEVSSMIRSINEMGEEEASRIYGIEFMDGGKVFDIMYNREFTSLGDWAEFTVEQEETETSEMFGYEDDTPY